MSVLERLVLRQGAEADLPVISELLSENGMDDLDDPVETCTVAEIDGEVAGFIHIETVEGRAWIRPVIVTPGFEGEGIGSTLVRSALEHCEELYIVARGDAVPFYERLGFTLLSWDEVPEVYCDECDRLCEDREACGPTPMVHRG
ncbi:MAG: GNAT family N-acetyltransferase [Coriobacteriia bacterium]